MCWHNTLVKVNTQQARFRRDYDLVSDRVQFISPPLRPRLLKQTYNTYNTHNCRDYSKYISTTIQNVHSQPQKHPLNCMHSNIEIHMIRHNSSVHRPISFGERVKCVFEFLQQTGTQSVITIIIIIIHCECIHNNTPWKFYGKSAHVIVKDLSINKIHKTASHFQFVKCSNSYWYWGTGGFEICCILCHMYFI